MFWLRHLYHTVYVTRERGTSDDLPCMKNKESQRIFQQTTGSPETGEDLFDFFFWYQFHFSFCGDNKR